jgi:HAD superfamily hydrolase (TIGR01484 family)
LDIDGTLLEHLGTVQPPVVDAIAAASAGGARVVLATGRSVLDTVPLAALVGSGYAVCSNGAVTVALPSVDVVDMVTFDAADVVARVARVVPDALIAVEEAGVGYGVTDYFPAGELHSPQRLRTVSEMLAEPVSRVIVRAVDRPVADFLAALAAVDFGAMSHAVGYQAWLDIGPPGVSKGSGLAALATRLGIDRADCLAIGDGRNDLEMLAWAGRGVAMGQAPPEVLAVADAVTSPVAAFGVATELATWFPPQPVRR